MTIGVEFTLLMIAEGRKARKQKEVPPARIARR